MKAPKPKTALQLARALKRYREMPNSAKAFDAVNSEWPPAIARIITDVFWSEVEMRSEKQVVSDLRALLRKAAKQSAAVASHRKRLARHA